jgi:hypothetical protein
MARVKTVYPTNEIPHLWFHGLGNGQTHARNAQGNLYFEGPYESAQIFSYGRHYEIARKVTTKRGLAILFNLEDSTVTTNGQKGLVRGAIPKDTPVFYIPELTGNHVLPRMHARNLESYAKRIESALLKAARAKSSWAKESNHDSAKQLTQERNAYVAFFALRNKALGPVPELDSKAVEQIRARESQRIKQVSEETKKRNAERAAKLAEEIELWKSGQLAYGHFPNTPAMLRVSGNEVETSLGARVPITHAKRALVLVRAVVSRGETWQTNGHTCHLGNYKLDRIEADGTLRAGCHVIARTEWERIAPQVEAAQVNEQEAQSEL